LQLAAGAKIALMDAYVTNGLEGMPKVTYSGSGPSPDGSYGYEFTPTDNVKRISILRVNSHAVIIIYYGGKNKKLDSLGLSLGLVPGFGGLQANGRPVCRLGEVGCTDDSSASSIVWGCVLTTYNTRPFKELARYVPARCRNPGGMQP
jgi:hypothetical protein